MEMSTGVSLLRTAQSLLTGRTILALIPDPVMHFTPQTSFRGIEDVEYIPKFGYRNLLNPNFFFILFFEKDPKGYKNIKKKYLN